MKHHHHLGHHHCHYENRLSWFSDCNIYPASGSYRTLSMTADQQSSHILQYKIACLMNTHIESVSTHLWVLKVNLRIMLLELVTVFALQGTIHDLHHVINRLK